MGLILSQVILYSGESIMSQSSLLRWLVYTVKGVFKTSSNSTFSQAP